MQQFNFNAGQKQQSQRVFLNIGRGTAGPERLPANFQKADWQQVRIDIDPGVKPDIVESFAILTMVASDSVHAIWSSHNLEHLPWHEVPLALSEAKRVLKPDGVVFLTLPEGEPPAAG